MRKYDQYRDDARGITNELCLLLALAVVGTVVVSALALSGVTVASSYAFLSATTSIKMPPEYWRALFLSRLFEAGGLTVLVVGGVAIYKTYQLAEGGGGLVASSMGGTRIVDGVSDPANRRLLNVVEELAIATGMRIPPVYVLEDEPGINAFVAGLDVNDAVVGITRGAVDRLQRHQLQGVIAHEFSHIKNGDMRLNIRLLGILTGIQSISCVARYLIRLGGTRSSRPKQGVGHGKHPLGIVLALAFGIAIWPIGQVGSFFALLINMAVNRQREFLADASAVEFTRDPLGLCEALQIIRNDEAGSRLLGPSARLANHMFFAGDDGAWRWLLQSHPPIEERIRRLNPTVRTSGDCGLLSNEPISEGANGSMHAALVGASEDDLCLADVAPPA